MSKSFYGEKQAPQIETPCPDCNFLVKSWKNWTSKGRGDNIIRTYQHTCPSCDAKFRIVERVDPEKIEVE